MDANAELVRPVEVRASGRYRIWIRFADNVAGDVDLSDLGGHGVFAAWDDPAVFASVRIGPARAICWGDNIDLCADALYLRLTGTSPEDYLPGLRPAATHA